MLPGLKRLAFATVAAGSVLAVAACGSSSGSDKASTVVQADNGEASKTGPQVLKDGVAAMLASGAVHGTGVGTEGKPAQAITVDMHLQSDGISIISKSPAGSFALIVIGKTTYTKNSGDDPTATGISSMILKKYANRWVKFTSASDTGVDDTTNLAGFAKSIARLDGGVTIAPKVTRGSLNGEDVVIVTESDGSSFSIAATGTPYVLQAVKVDSSKDGSYGGGKLT
ncbi:MAG: hypothetical protein JWN96_3795, partial [Mycobacterium sp.]|nr:hypothetical protein [Mycobacterium sp.]